MNQAKKILEAIIDYSKEYKLSDNKPGQIRRRLMEYKETPLKQLFVSQFSSLALQQYLTKHIDNINFRLNGCDSLQDIINNHTKDKL